MPKTNARYMSKYTLHVTRGHQPLLTATAHVGLYDDFVEIPW
jgi:hypothetical protein